MKTTFGIILFPLILTFVSSKSVTSDRVNINPFVVNGTDANIGEFPFMVSIRGTTGSHGCGGTILNEYWVLTAAHCIPASPVNRTVQYGNSEISRNGSNVVEIEEYFVHEDYNNKTLENDIALIKLKTPIENQLFDYRVRLPTAGAYYPTGTKSVLAGWGLDKTNGTAQTTLQKADLIVFTANDCRKLHRDEIFYTNICGGVPEGGKGQCSGDSGGPLLVDGVQVGIVSWSEKPCTIAPYPGVYTGVMHYIGWIEEKMGRKLETTISLRARSAV